MDKKNKIKKLSDHQKLINLITVHGEKDINKFLQSLDKIFTEIFHLKKTELPWCNTNSNKEWTDFMRKSRLAFCIIYYRFIKKDRILSALYNNKQNWIALLFNRDKLYYDFYPIGICGSRWHLPSFCKSSGGLFYYTTHFKYATA